MIDLPQGDSDYWFHTISFLQWDLITHSLFVLFYLHLRQLSLKIYKFLTTVFVALQESKSYTISI